MKKEKPVLTEKQVERNAKIKSALKGLIAPTILTALIAAAIFFVINYQNKEDEEEIIMLESYGGTEEMIVVENDELQLTMDPVTTQFSVKVKATGAQWLSNPTEASSDSLALPEEIQQLWL